MTWEEDTTVERLLRLLFGWKRDVVARDRRRERMRYFLGAWGAAHWADRV